MGANLYGVAELAAPGLWGAALSAVCCLAVASLGAAETPSADVACDAKRAYEYLVEVCGIGPRISGSDGMEKQQQLLSDHFTKLGAQVRFQSFDAPHPIHGRPVRLSNLIVSWHPEAKERVLLCCHYDTRPLPDNDSNPRLASSGTFLGANDGASGVALFMELARHIPRIAPTYGIDFVLFDGEEFVYGRPKESAWFLGSRHFARNYREHPPEHKYVYGVLVDMVADKNLQIYQEAYSLKYAPQLTQSIWQTAKRVGVKEFVAERKHEVRDDHLPLNQIALIPTCDLIDFDYAHWHTTRDVPSNCAGDSLAKVGKVLLAWLQEVPPPANKRAK